MIADMRERVAFYAIVKIDDGMQVKEDLSPIPVWSCYAAYEGHAGSEEDDAARIVYTTKKVYRIRQTALVSSTKMVMRHRNIDYDIIDIDYRDAGSQWMWIVVEGRI